MSNTYYLAVDIGASSGRHILGHLEEGKMVLEEIYRFDNGMKPKDGHLCWDAEGLFREIKAGMKRCKELSKIPVSMGVDTWAVDYVLLDKNGERLGDAVGYRDKRTEGMDDKVYEIISPEELYGRTGIQKQIFNTIYQLMAVKEQQPELMEEAEQLLMLPDYFHYLLTGVAKTEYTNATSGQLVSPVTKDWDYELIERLGYKKEIFGPISLPGTVVGPLKKEVAEEVGFSCTVMQPATHDTASAVLAVPSTEEDVIYISSGTWSLMGTELKEADCREESRRANFTNEGGVNYRFRFLKNIMGLWMIQSVRRELPEKYSYAELCKMAEEVSDFPTVIDVNDQSFLAPDSMIEAIQEYCRKHDQAVPKTPGELAAVIYQNLARSYGETVWEIEELTGKTYDKIHVVGGGSNADYLNELTAWYTKKEVLAGPGEATALGNLAAQMIAAGELKDIWDARECIRNSFEIRSFRA